MALKLIRDIMTKDVITVPLDMPLLDVFKVLSKHNISFVVVVEGEKTPVGVITERDVVNLTAHHKNASDLLAKDVMSVPLVVVVGEEIDVAEAYHRLKLKHKRHLVILGENGELSGVVTLTDFIRHLGVEVFIEHKPLSQILTAEPIMVTPESTTIAAINLMSEHKISCMIIAKDHKPVGILTERDVLRLKASGSFVENSPISEVMTHPVLTVHSDMNTSDASKLMQTKHIRHLIVVDEPGLIVGVLTETNIVQGMEGRYVQSIIQLLDEKDVQLRAVNTRLEERVVERTATLKREIEAHKSSQRAMEKLTIALQQAGEAVIITDPQGHIEYVNESFTTTTGYTLAEVAGEKPSILQSGRQDKTFYKHMWKKLLDTNEWKGVLWNKRKNDEEYPEQLHIRGIKDSEGQLINYVGTFSDITEKTTLEAEYRHAQRMEVIGSLVGGVAHNFNNILAGMTGKLYLAKRKAEASPEIFPYLKSMEDLSFQAANMINQLLTFARKEITERSNLPLVPLMQEAMKTARLGVPEDIHMVSDFCDESLTVFGDATQLQQVMMNIVNNARDAMTDKPPMSISVSLNRFKAGKYFLKKHPALKGKELACLSIEDSGEGIEKTDLEHIFEPFFTTKPVGQGTGLGLSMSKGAIDSHGGVIDVDSTVGKGTVFKIYLPLVENTSSVSNKTKEIVEGRGELILLVDDERIVIEGTSEILEALGYKVITSTSGNEALDLYRRHEQDIALILTDIVMPGMGGNELAKEIHKHSQVPIILMTGYAFKRQSDNHDAFTIRMGKPFQIAELSQIISKLIRG